MNIVFVEPSFPRNQRRFVHALRSVGADEYQLVRTTAYVKPGTTHGTQGARILFDSSKVKLISTCAETTGKLNYNASCSIDLPRMSGDGKSETRSGASALVSGHGLGVSRSSDVT